MFHSDLFWARTGIPLVISKPWHEFGETVRRRSVRHPPIDRRTILTRVSAGFVYRFQTTGTIEEKIFQRQCQKQNLSACVVDEAEDTARHFTQDDLRQLFKFNTETLCDTHDTYKCKRCRDGKQYVKAPALLYGDAST